MPVYEVGQTIPFVLHHRTAGGNLANLAATPAAAVTKPDGTVVAPAPTVTNPSTGAYAASVTAAALGRYRCAWAGSGVAYTDHADVLDMSRLIVPLADARAALNIPASVVVNDDELRGYLAAATVVVEDLIGPVLGATKVEARSGGNRYAINLFDYPTAITSVVEDGTTLAAADYCVDEAGTLWRGSRPGGGYWPNGAGNVVITYTVGTAVIPPNVLLAAREQVRFLYQVGQQGNRPQLGESATEYGPTIAGYAVPNRVIELCKPSMAGRAPGIA